MQCAAESRLFEGREGGFAQWQGTDYLNAQNNKTCQENKGWSHQLTTTGGIAGCHSENEFPLLAGENSFQQRCWRQWGLAQKILWSLKASALC